MGLLTDWEYKAPPSHVEGKGICSGYHDNGDNKPYQRETPQQNADY
jgi:hypothetical protein